MPKQLVITSGMIAFSQKLLIDWINEKLPIDERYTSFIRACEIAMKISFDKANKNEITELKKEWEALDKLKSTHIQVISDEERLKLTRFGEYGYFPDEVYGGENPIEYKNFLSNKIMAGKKEREKLSTKVSILMYSAFTGTEIIEERLKRALEKAIGLYKEKPTSFR